MSQTYCDANCYLSNCESQQPHLQDGVLPWGALQGEPPGKVLICGGDFRLQTEPSCAQGEGQEGRQRTAELWARRAGAQGHPCFMAASGGQDTGCLTPTASFPVCQAAHARSSPTLLWGPRGSSSLQSRTHSHLWPHPAPIILGNPFLPPFPLIQPGFSGTNGFKTVSSKQHQYPQHDGVSCVEIPSCVLAQSPPACLGGTHIPAASAAASPHSRRWLLESSHSSERASF